MGCSATTIKENESKMFSFHTSACCYLCSMESNCDCFHLRTVTSHREPESSPENTTRANLTKIEQPGLHRDP